MRGCGYGTKQRRIVNHSDVKKYDAVCACAYKSTVSCDILIKNKFTDMVLTKSGPGLVYTYVTVICVWVNCMRGGCTSL